MHLNCKWMHCALNTACLNAGHVSWLTARVHQNVSGFPAGWYAIDQRDDAFLMRSSWCLTTSSQYVLTTLLSGPLPTAYCTRHTIINKTVLSPRRLWRSVLLGNVNLSSNCQATIWWLTLVKLDRCAVCKVWRQHCQFYISNTLTASSWSSSGPSLKWISPWFLFDNNVWLCS